MSNRSKQSNSTCVFEHNVKVMVDIHMYFSYDIVKYMSVFGIVNVQLCGYKDKSNAQLVLKQQTKKLGITVSVT